jgi:hypothetical protein
MKGLSSFHSCLSRCSETPIKQVTAMNRFKRLYLPLLMGVCAPVHAASFEMPNGSQFDISGFTKHEWGRAFSSIHTLTNQQSAWTPDSRNALSKPDIADVGLANRDSELSIQQLSLGWKHETAGAVSLEARMTYRWRSDQAFEVFEAPDLDYKLGDGSLWKSDFTEKFFGVSRPDIGSLKFGTLLSRSWSRSDAFSFPVGQSGSWADSGAGFAILPTALQLTSPVFEDGSGKLTAELTLATNSKNTFMVDQNRLTPSNEPYSPNPTTPQAVEVFLQFSNSKNLIELVMQSASGAKQTSFGKSALVGWIGDPDTTSAGEPRKAGKPSQSIISLQGNHWPNPQNMLTWGVRRNQWSGSAATCNYTAGDCVYGIDAGFNYGPANTSYRGYRAKTFDALLGWSHYRGPYTYTLSGVYFGRASSANPIEWGQNNSALHFSLGVARQVPEIHKGLSVSGGISLTRFEKIGPAPLSMPNNNFLGVNPLYKKQGQGATVGLTWVY